MAPVDVVPLDYWMMMRARRDVDFNRRIRGSEGAEKMREEITRKIRLEKTQTIEVSVS